MNRRNFIILTLFLLGLAAYSFGRSILPAAGIPWPALESLMAEKSNRYRTDPALTKAIAKVESNFNPAAKNPHDPSYGLMQITPALAFDYGLISDWQNPTAKDIKAMMDPENNLDVACQHLSYLTRTQKFDVAVQMYNVGQAGYMKGKRNFDYLNKVRKYHDIYYT